MHFNKPQTGDSGSGLLSMLAWGCREQKPDPVQTHPATAGAHNQTCLLFFRASNPLVKLQTLSISVFSHWLIGAQLRGWTAGASVVPPWHAKDLYIVYVEGSNIGKQVVWAEQQTWSGLVGHGGRQHLFLRAGWITLFDESLLSSDSLMWGRI